MENYIVNASTLSILEVTHIIMLGLVQAIFDITESMLNPTALKTAKTP